MNSKLIKGYNLNSIDLDFIRSDEWDLIILNKKIDSSDIFKWYQAVSNNLNHLKFNFLKNSNLLKPSLNNIFYTNKEKYAFDKTRADIKLINSYVFTWPVQKNIPLPPIWAADPTQFPEIQQYCDNNNQIDKDINYKSWKYQEPYLFGEFKNQIESWGKQYWRNSRITEHLPGLILPSHTDGMIARIHIPITKDESKFYWGDNNEREYKLEVGNIYLINSHTPHSTSNGLTIRANIMADIDELSIIEILSI